MSLDNVRVATRWDLTHGSRVSNETNYPRTSAMIDISSEYLLRLREVPDHLPRRGEKKLHYSTAYRWAKRGVEGPESPIILESVKIGGSVYTSLEALERFTRQRSQRVGIRHGPGTDSSPSRSKHTDNSLAGMEDWRPDQHSREEER